MGLFNCSTASLLLILAVILPAAGAVTVTDDTGAIVEIASIPQRIISLSPSTTEILFALGLDDRIVGVTEYCDYPPAALDKPKVGGFHTVSIEKVIVQKPDLIVASHGNDEALLENLQSLGFPVVALNSESIAGLLDDIRLVGRATGEEENATMLVADLERRIDAVKERVGTATERPSVAHVIWHEPIYVSGRGTFQDEMIGIAGGRNVFSHLDGWKNVGIEDVLHANPDVLIVNTGSGMGGGEDVIAQFFKEEPRFSGVSAIRNNRIYLVDSDTADRAGPRIVDALELFAKDIHPELFGHETADAHATSATGTPGFEWRVAMCACVAAAVLLARRFG